MRRLTAQNVRFWWMEECQAAFRELKRLLVDSMVMVDHELVDRWDKAIE